MHPSFSWRLLALQGDTALQLSDCLQLTVPGAWLERDLTPMCKTIRALGYNGVILGGQQASGKNDKLSLLPLLKQCSAHDINVFLHPSLNASMSKCPASPDYRTFVGIALRDLLRVYPSIGGIFWSSKLHEADYFDHVDACDALQLDLLCQELSGVEKGIMGKVPLIFYVPSQEEEGARRDARSIQRLMEDAARGTMVAFSAVAGDATADHQPLHPVWELLQKFSEPLGTRVLPLLNTGGVGLGGGEWPALMLEQFEVISRMDAKQCAGMICLSQQVPAEASVAGCNLWVAAQLLERPEAPDRLIDEWMKRHRPEWIQGGVKALWKQCRAFVIELSQMKEMTLQRHPRGRSAVPAEELKLIIDSVAVHYRKLQLGFSKERRFPQGEAEKFLADAKAMMKQFAKQYNISSAQIQ